MSKASQSPGDSSRLPTGNVRPPDSKNPADSDRLLDKAALQAQELRLLLDISNAKRGKTYG